MPAMARNSGSEGHRLGLVQGMVASFIMLIVLAGAGAILFLVADRTPRDAPRVVAGEIDLDAWDFAKRGPISLTGEWRFSPSADSGSGRLLVRVPGDWRRAADGERAMPGAYGIGRYSVLLLGLPAGTDPALLVPDEAIAWSLSIDGRIAVSSGKPGSTAGDTMVRRESAVVPLPRGAEGEDREVSILVSNFSYDVGGLINPVLIGPARTLSFRLEAMGILNGFFVGGLFVIAIFHFFLFVRRMDDRSSLYFSLFCFLSMIRSLVIAHYPERLISSIALGSAPFDVSVRLEYLCFYIGIPAYLAFVLSVFPDESDRRLLKTNLAIGLAFAAIVAATPVPFFMAWTTKPYQIVTLCVGLYTLYVFIRASAARREGAVYGLVGFAIFFLIAINDILHADLVVRTAYLSPLGLMIFMISHSFIVSSRIAATYERERLLSAELSEEKRLLDARIEERTSELSASNAKLQDLDKAKSRFLATISHELRTPLSLLISPLEQAAKGAYGEALPIGGEVLPRLLRNGYRLLNLVEGMFDFARLELGRLEPHIEPVDLAKLLSFYAAEFEAVAQRKGLALSLGLELQSGCAARLDRRLFEIAFFNILSNALKFTPAGGSILIGASGPDPNGFASIRVTDDGIGIEAELLPRVFDKLDWKPRESEDMRDGAGIGLSLCKKIIGLHGGEIAAESAPGEGSTFTIRIPAFLGGFLPPREEGLGDRSLRILGEAQSSPPWLSSSTQAGLPVVLIADDNGDLLGFLHEILESRFDVHPARDGLEALELLQGGLEPDLIVCDVMMPKMDGPRFFEEAGRLLGDGRPPFVFLTAKDDPGERLAALRGGAIDYLTKPFDADELIQRMEGLSAMRSREREVGRKELQLALDRYMSAMGSKDSPSGFDTLTPREAEIAELATRGMQDKEIAAALGLATRTISNTLARIYRKLGVGTRVELVHKRGGRR
jgi:signal transduction histidine kinase/DNA-binding NarL/FixJ family response regulator